METRSPHISFPMGLGPGVGGLLVRHRGFLGHPPQLSQPVQNEVDANNQGVSLAVFVYFILAGLYNTLESRATGSPRGFSGTTQARARNLLKTNSVSTICYRGPCVQQHIRNKYDLSVCAACAPTKRSFSCLCRGNTLHKTNGKHSSLYNKNVTTLFHYATPHASLPWKEVPELETAR